MSKTTTDFSATSPRSQEALLRFPQFCEEVFKRLAVGAAEYGDKSFEKTTETLLDEVKQELFDVCGWSFILYAKIEALLERVERESASDTPRP